MRFGLELPSRGLGERSEEGWRPTGEGEAGELRWRSQDGRERLGGGSGGGEKREGRRRIGMVLEEPRQREEWWVASCKVRISTPPRTASSQE